MAAQYQAPFEPLPEVIGERKGFAACPVMNGNPATTSWTTVLGVGQYQPATRINLGCERCKADHVWVDDERYTHQHCRQCDLTTMGNEHKLPSGELFCPSCGDDGNLAEYHHIRTAVVCHHCNLVIKRQDMSKYQFVARHAMTKEAARTKVETTVVHPKCGRNLYVDEMLYTRAWCDACQEHEEAEPTPMANCTCVTCGAGLLSYHNITYQLVCPVCDKVLPGADPAAVFVDLDRPSTPPAKKPRRVPPEAPRR